MIIFMEGKSLEDTNEIFLDTSFAIAIVSTNETDELHKKAQYIWLDKIEDFEILRL